MRKLLTLPTGVILEENKEGWKAKVQQMLGSLTKAGKSEIEIRRLLERHMQALNVAQAVEHQIVEKLSWARDGKGDLDGQALRLFIKLAEDVMRLSGYGEEKIAEVIEILQEGTWDTAHEKLLYALTREINLEMGLNPESAPPL